MNKHLNYILLTLCALVGLSSCTKTEILPYEEEPAKLISSFKIINTATELTGNINEKEKTITLIIPQGEYYNSLEPEITLHTGNTLKTDADTLITDIFDYFVNGRDILYPITDKEGTERTYRLIIKAAQPPLSFIEVSPDMDHIKRFNLRRQGANFDYDLNLYISNTNSNYPYSSNVELNRELSRASLIAADGTEYPISGAYGYPTNGYSQFSMHLAGTEGIAIPNTTPPEYREDVPEGLYWIRIRYYSKETTLKNPIRIYYQTI